MPPNLLDNHTHEKLYSWLETENFKIEIVYYISSRYLIPSYPPLDSLIIGKYLNIDVI